MDVPRELPPRILSGPVRDRVEKLLVEYVRTVKACYVVLAERDGQFITKAGDSGGADMETVAALAAGAIMVSWQMARALGKDDFNVVYHEGEQDKVQLSKVDDRTILAVIFDARATLGMVRLYAKSLMRQVQAILAEVPVRPPGRSRGR